MDDSTGEVVAFPNRGASCLSWDALRLANATRAAAAALDDGFSQAERFAEMSRVEAKLAADAAALGDILRSLSDDLTALRGRYL